MANNLDCNNGASGSTRHFDNIIRTRPPNSHVFNRGAGREDSSSDPGNVPFESFKRKHVFDYDHDSNPTSRNGEREELIDQNVRNGQMTYDELSEQVKILTALSLENQNSNISLAKRFKSERDFGSTGNKAQHTVISNIIDAADEGLYSLSCRNLKNVENCFLGIKAEAVERSKMICMADTSEFGWATVAAYKNNAQFLDDEEDKRFKRAEQSVRASRKTKADSASKPKGRGAGRGRGRGVSNNEATPVVAPNQAYQTPVYAPPMQTYPFMSDPYTGYFNMPPFPAMAGHFPGPNMYAQGHQQQAKGPVKCYGCHQYGHVKTDCPNRHLWQNNPATTVTK
jgi:hypothetical protein